MGTEDGSQMNLFRPLSHRLSHPSTTTTRDHHHQQHHHPPPTHTLYYYHHQGAMVAMAVPCTDHHRVFFSLSLSFPPPRPPQDHHRLTPTRDHRDPRDHLPPTRTRRDHQHRPPPTTTTIKDPQHPQDPLLLPTQTHQEEDPHLLRPTRTHRRPPAKQQGPGSLGSPAPVPPMEWGGRGRKRLALLSPSEARWSCGLLPEESFPLQNAAARSSFGAVGATGPRR